MKLDIAPGRRSRTLTVAAILSASLVTGGWLIVRGTHAGAATPVVPHVGTHTSFATRCANS